MFVIDEMERRLRALGFGWAHDTTLLEPFVDRYHEVIERVWDERTHHMA